MLSPRDLARYSRQMLVKNIGYKGQMKLAESKVAIVGCGATGSFMANLLARMGVGYIRLIDRDIVELSNLHRTNLLDEEDVEKAKPKSVACREKILRINSSIRVEAVIDRLSKQNAEKLLVGVDLILDGTDDVETRLLINDFAVKHGIPWIYVGVERWYGVVMPIIPGETACYRCIIDKPPERRGNACEYLGVINPAVALTTSIAASLALRILLSEKVEGAMYIIDAWRNEVNKIKIVRNPRCPACVLNRYDYLEGETVSGASVICGSNQVEILPPKQLRLELENLRGLNEVRVLKFNKYVALIQFQDLELMLFNNGRAIVTNTIDREKALRGYEKLLEKLKREGVIRR